MEFVVKVKTLNDPDFITLDGSFSKEDPISKVWKEVAEEFANDPDRSEDKIAETLRSEGLKLKWKKDGEWEELTAEFDTKKLGEVW